MKSIDKLKTIQIICFSVLAVVSGCVIVLSDSLFHTIANDTGVKMMCLMLWLVLGLCFFFIYLDMSLLSRFKNDFRELDYAVHSDPVAGIANRYSSDALIDKYIDKELPNNIGCIMLELSNIREINQLHGHRAGNESIRKFSTLLKMVSVNTCFVSRNGGNKFLAIFEDCSPESIDSFIERLSRMVSNYNEEDDSTHIEYHYGVALSEDSDVETITALIALSDRRIRDKDAK